MSTARHHAEWLSLVEVSGPFLSLSVLLNVFPQGLDKPESGLSQNLRLAYEEWQESQQGSRPDRAIHNAWLRYVLTNLLGYEDAVLADGPAIAHLHADFPEQGETVRPSLALVNPSGREDAGQPRLLIMLLPAKQGLDRQLAGSKWTASPATRMMELLHATGVRLGLVTNGEQWMLVDAPKNETTGFASWFSSLWFDEPITLQAFRSLLEARRFFGVSDADTIEQMLARSAEDQQEVTDQLGYQVRQAVELLVRTISYVDKDRNHHLLDGVAESELYEAALTVMMRLVFLFSAEERGLLLLGTERYDQFYAASTLRAQLRETADQQGEEVLERRRDAWSRLLATFRLVYGGARYDDLSLPAYGGHLFDPDRFPFLEGRASGTSWQDTAARPLPIDNRTVLHLLEALQILRVKVPGGGGAEPRRLSFRALDIEQIGHVYEGLLDHTARRASEPVLGLVGSRDRKQDTEPEIPLSQMEREWAKGEDSFIAFVAEESKRSSGAIKSALGLAPAGGGRGRKPAALSPQLSFAAPAKAGPADLDEGKLLAACDNDEALFRRVLPFAGLIRRDTFDRYMVITAGSVYVTEGSDRRSTGTHYTPRSLTEPIVQYALEPLVYAGPAEGWEQKDWQLRPARELLALKICDMAMGSGAFLVQACRYLSERLVEAWEAASNQNRLQITPEGEPSTGAPNETIIPTDNDERLIFARRLVAERCLYGVDKNPLAVEMAKLSLWLVTLQKDRPFGFLDHALRGGDSLLGVDVEQLSKWGLGRKGRANPALQKPIRDAFAKAVRLRQQIELRPVFDVRDAAEKERLLHEAEAATAIVRLGGDLLVATALHPNPKQRDRLAEDFFTRYILLLNEAEFADDENARLSLAGKPSRAANLQASISSLQADASAILQGRRPFHWPLEFPEVFDGDNPGFSAIIGNPPFQGSQMIKAALGTLYRDFLINNIASGKTGKSDLVAYFFLRASLLSCFGASMGFIATNSIAQGDTRVVGLDQIADSGWHIMRAIPTREWPGVAGVSVAEVWSHKGRWLGVSVLDNKKVDNITPYLTPADTVQGNPYSLITNAGKSFQGSIVLGGGFVLEPSEAKALLTHNPKNKEVIFPYLNGEDINVRPDQSPSRYVINFFDWASEQAQRYSDCWSIIETKVKPERQRKTEQGEFALRKPLPQRYWIYADKRPALYATIANMKRVLVLPLTSKYLTATWQSANIVYSHATGVIANESGALFALVQSTFHEVWVRQYASTMGNTLRYTPSDCFETFPFPTNMGSLEDIGQRYYEHRQSIMLARQEGLTKTYNRMHNPAEHSEDIEKLRQLHKQMDEAVAAAYGWQDLDLGHGFHQTKQGLRYTISEAARREVLNRLLKLNHERYEEEVRQGLHDKAAKKAAATAKRGRKAAAEQEQLL